MSVSGGSGRGPVSSAGLWPADGSASLVLPATPAAGGFGSYRASGSSLPYHAGPMTPAMLHTQHKQQPAQLPQHSQHQFQPWLGPVLHLNQHLTQLQSSSQGVSRGTAAAASICRPNSLPHCMGAPLILPYFLLPATTPVLVTHSSAPNRIMPMQAADAAGQLLAFARPTSYGGNPCAVYPGTTVSLQMSETVRVAATAAAPDVLGEVQSIAGSTMPVITAAAAAPIAES